MAMQILAHKMEAVNANRRRHHRHRQPGLPAAASSRRAITRLGQRVMHVVEILDEAYKAK